MAVNEDGVAVSCGDNGTIDFWDYETGYCFQKSSTIAQPGSLDAECGIYAAGFDLSGRYGKHTSKHANLYCVFVPCVTFKPFLPFYHAHSFRFVSTIHGSRLVTCEADKSIKIWKENPLSTEASDPIDMDAWSKECLQLKRY